MIEHLINFEILITQKSEFDHLYHYSFCNSGELKTLNCNFDKKLLTRVQRKSCICLQKYYYYYKDLFTHEDYIDNWCSLKELSLCNKL